MMVLGHTILPNEQILLLILFLGMPGAYSSSCLPIGPMRRIFPTPIFLLVSFPWGAPLSVLRDYCRGWKPLWSRPTNTRRDPVQDRSLVDNVSGAYASCCRKFHVSTHTTYEYWFNYKPIGKRGRECMQKAKRSVPICYMCPSDNQERKII
jgi:hypothetical protein